MTTRMSKLPSEISVNDLSVYQVMFFSTCETRTRGNGDRTQQQPAGTKQKRCIEWHFTHHLVDGAIEGVVLSEDEQNDEGHVDVMRVSVLHMVQDLQDGQHL